MSEIRRAEQVMFRLEEGRTLSPPIGTFLGRGGPTSNITLPQKRESKSHVPCPIRARFGNGRGPRIRGRIPRPWAGSALARPEGVSTVYGTVMAVYCPAARAAMHPPPPDRAQRPCGRRESSRQGNLPV